MTIINVNGEEIPISPTANITVNQHGVHISDPVQEIHTGVNPEILIYGNIGSLKTADGEINVLGNVNHLNSLSGNVTAQSIQEAEIVHGDVTLTKDADSLIVGHGNVTLDSNVMFLEAVHGDVIANNVDNVRTVHGNVYHSGPVRKINQITTEHFREKRIMARNTRK